jgi:hypothetical protein
MARRASTSSLWRGHSDVLEHQIRATHPGMAHFANTGPFRSPTARRTTMQIMARICFHASDAKAGVSALHTHGYAVLRHVFPDEPDHVFVEAYRDVSAATEINELDAVSEIIKSAYGFVSDCGRVPAGHVPFEYEGAPWK